jgi:threonine dehydrogenase-like Zn-dependent dehydrogenase
MVVNPHDRTVRLVNREGPRKPIGSDVLLRTLEVGICGTDREICSFHYGRPPEGSEELIIGHEAIAEVVEAGPDTIWVHPGDLVVPVVRRPCSSKRCAACRQGRPDFCITGQATERGIVGANGFLSDYFVAKEHFLISVPQALRDVAVLLEPLSVVAKGVEAAEAIRTRLGFVMPRHSALILGAGPVGILTAMAAVAGDMTTFVFSREGDDDPRVALLKSIGVTYLSAGATPLDQLGEVVGDLDLIFEAVGVPQVAFGALPLLGPNGVYVMTGVPAPGGPAQAELARWMRDIVLRNQSILGTVNAGRSAFESAVHRLEQFMGLFPEAVRGLIKRHSIEEAPAVLERARGLKDVVTLAA